jgi:hypothetical protein
MAAYRWRSLAGVALVAAGLAAASACASAAPGSRVYVRVGPGYLVI